jgi:hypothetical protein
VGSLVQSPTHERLASQGFTQGPGGIITAYDGGLDQFGQFAHAFQTAPNAFDPVWSPDETRIAYAFCDRRTTSFPGGPCSVQTIGAEVSPVVVYPGPAVEGADWIRGYDWMPDSSALVLSVSSDGPFRLVLAQADGSGSEPLLAGTDNQYTPVVRP